MKMEDAIKHKIRENINSEQIIVTNESNKHIGHSGDDGSGETHYSLVIVSSDFSGLNRVQRHKLVHNVLAVEIKKIHSLTLQALTPFEVKNT